ncbi:MAG: GntR family transcriptional regulator [Paracoccaceae bacterium]
MSGDPQGWEAIRAEVLARIRRRDWAPGQMIPTEEELAREFGCARATVNRALRDLAEGGLLERRRKAGTRVTENPVRKATLSIPVIRQEVEATGRTYAARLIRAERRAPSEPVAGQLGVPAGAVLWHLVTLHLAASRPHAAENRWLNPAALPPRWTPERLGTLSVNEWLVRHVGFAWGDIAFSAEAAQEEEAALLGLDRGAAIFVTERTTWAEDHAITAVRLAHAPGYRLHTVL